MTSFSVKKITFYQFDIYVFIAKMEIISIVYVFKLGI